MSAKSKLSCLSWNKYAKNHIASSDYKGIVTIWDVDTQQVRTGLFGWYVRCVAEICFLTIPSVCCCVQSLELLYFICRDFHVVFAESDGV